MIPWITLKIFRCLYRWCPPLPIPNREVKPTRADGTAVTRGRVGRCQILKKPCNSKLQGFLVYKLFPSRFHNKRCHLNLMVRKSFLELQTFRYVANFFKKIGGTAGLELNIQHCWGFTSLN